MGSVVQNGAWDQRPRGGGLFDGSAVFSRGHFRFGPARNKNLRSKVLAFEQKHIFDLESHCVDTSITILPILLKLTF